MRHNAVAMEKLFWAKLRDRRLGGYKFRRQYLIGPYIADFVCTERKLIIELDGPLHADQVDSDRRRDAYAAKELRIERSRPLKNPTNIGLPLTPALSPSGGEGEPLA